MITKDLPPYSIVYVWLVFNSVDPYLSPKDSPRPNASARPVVESKAIETAVRITAAGNTFVKNWFPMREECKRIVRDVGIKRDLLGFESLHQLPWDVHLCETRDSGPFVARGVSCAVALISNCGGDGTE
jgi:hypothetical protein